MSGRMDVTSITDPDQMRAYRDGYAQGQIDGAKAKADAVADLIAEALQRAHGVVDHDCQSQDEHDGLLRAQDVVAKIRGES